MTRGKNLLKLKEVNSTIRGVAVSVKNNSITVKGTAKSNGGRTDYLSESFVLQPGTYFISGNVVNSLVYCLTDVSNGKAVVALSSTSKFTLAEKIEVAFGSNVISGVSYDATVNVMLNDGNKFLPYEPYHEPITTPIYLDSPLYKIGDYADRLSKTEEVRVIKELILTGNENWIEIGGNANNTTALFTCEINDIIDCGNVAAMDVLTTHYKVGAYFSASVTSEGLQHTRKNIYIRSKQLNVADFKAYLAAQYAAGIPVKVYYVMKTPETKTVEPVEIPTLNGTTVIDVDTAMKPTEMYTKYKSSK